MDNEPRIPFSKEPEKRWDDVKRERADAHRQLQGWSSELVRMDQDKRAWVIGVVHDRSNFEMHKSEIEKAVRRASVVLVEGSPIYDSPTSKSPREFGEPNFPLKRHVDAFRDELRGMTRSGVALPVDPDKVSDDEIRREIIMYQKGKEDFFEKITQVAAHYGKPIAYADPLGAIRQKFAERMAEPRNQGKNPFHIPREEEEILDAMLYGGLTIAAASTFASRLLQDRVSRRGFLGIATGAAVAAATGGISQISNRLENATLVRGAPLGRASNPLGAFRYGSILDYREIVAGLATKRLAELFDDKLLYPTVIMGRSHAESIAHYASSPVEAHARLKAYPHRNAYDDPTLSVYDFDKQRGWWVLRTKESLNK